MKDSNLSNLNQEELIQNMKRLSSLNKDLESTYLSTVQEKETHTTGKIRDLLLQMNGFMKAIIALSKNTSSEKKVIAIEKKFKQLNSGIDSGHTHVQVNRKRFKDFKKEIDGFLEKIQS